MVSILEGMTPQEKTQAHAVMLIAMMSAKTKQEIFRIFTEEGEL